MWNATVSGYRNQGNRKWVLVWEVKSRVTTNSRRMMTWLGERIRKQAKCSVYIEDKDNTLGDQWLSGKRQVEVRSLSSGQPNRTKNPKRIRATQRWKENGQQSTWIYDWGQCTVVNPFPEALLKRIGDVGAPPAGTLLWHPGLMLALWWRGPRSAFNLVWWWWWWRRCVGWLVQYSHVCLCMYVCEWDWQKDREKEKIFYHYL